MDKTAIYNAKKSLIDKHLGSALSSISPLLNHPAYQPLHEPIIKLREDYELMLQYMRKGYPDPQREQVYLSLLRKLDRLTNEAARIMRQVKDPHHIHHTATPPLAHSELSRRIEDHVSEIAMLSLDDNDATINSRQLYENHHRLMSQLFEHLSFSSQWHHDDQSYYEQLILSPTTDIVDSSLMVSGITLSVITHFDVYKYLTLIQVYLHASDEVLRQRALVGWALTTTRTHFLYPELSPILQSLFSDSETASQVLELQTQLFFCMNAESDTNQIARDIMPNLMKNKDFDITRHGIVEKSDDPMKDILDPEASDRAMEELEQSFQKMSEMQRNGSDIYFGGFSKMKRYPFFYTLSNWFCPFYTQHPGLEGTRNKLHGDQFLHQMMEQGPFCDSDKYSFALAMASVIDKIPDNMKSMLNEGFSFDAMGTGEMLKTPATIRLMYLQDLYRFFRLSDYHTCFFNPFGGNDGQNALIMSSDILIAFVSPENHLKFGQFLLKRGQYAALDKLLSRIGNRLSSPQVELLRGYSHLHHEEYAEAQACFLSVTAIDSNHTRALRGLARASFLLKDYPTAEQTYRHLLDLSPDNTSHALNLAFAQIKNGHAEEATPLLYKLHYEHPETTDITRILAWALLANQKIDQAIKEYARLLSGESPKAEDYLNIGYCHWIKGNITEAITSFHQCLQKASDTGHPLSLEEEFKKDSDILEANGLSRYSLLMMCDIMSREIL